MKIEKRGFGGKITNFETKEERKHEQLHLKAYLKGQKRFKNGYKLNEANERVEAWFDVNEVWGEREMTKKEIKKHNKKSLNITFK